MYGSHVNNASRSCSALKGAHWASAVAVWPVSQRARGHLNRIRRLSMPVPSYLELMIEQHHSVVAAVADHDAAGAETLLRDHLRNVLQEVPRIRAEHPGFFEEA